MASLFGQRGGHRWASRRVQRARGLLAAVAGGALLRVVLRRRLVVPPALLRAAGRGDLLGLQVADLDGLHACVAARGADACLHSW